jgi:hypothetical protein
MKNITKLSIWPNLVKLGFTPVKFKFNGKIQSIGAVLEDEGGLEVILLEPTYSEWKMVSRFGTGIYADFSDAKNLQSKILEKLAEHSATYLVQFFNDHIQFASPLVYNCLDTPSEVASMMEKAGKKLKEYVEQFYTNGEAKTGTWYCSFSQLKPYSKDAMVYFETDVLYRQRIKIQFGNGK